MNIVIALFPGQINVISPLLAAFVVEVGPLTVKRLVNTGRKSEEEEENC